MWRTAEKTPSSGHDTSLLHTHTHTDIYVVKAKDDPTKKSERHFLARQRINQQKSIERPYSESWVNVCALDLWGKPELERSLISPHLCEQEALVDHRTGSAPFGEERSDELHQNWSWKRRSRASYWSSLTSWRLWGEWGSSCKRRQESNPELCASCYRCPGHQRSACLCSLHPLQETHKRPEHQWGIKQQWEKTHLSIGWRNGWAELLLLLMRKHTNRLSVS